MRVYLLLLLVFISGCRLLEMEVIKDTDQKIDGVDDIFGVRIELDKNCTDWARSILPESITVDKIDDARYQFTDDEIYWKDGTLLFFNEYLKNLKLQIGEDGLFHHPYQFGNNQYPFEYRARAVDKDQNVLGYNVIKLKPVFRLVSDTYPYAMEIATPNFIECKRLNKPS